MTYSLLRIAEVKNYFKILMETANNLIDLGGAKQ
jgi:hypothetical protein